LQAQLARQPHSSGNFNVFAKLTDKPFGVNLILHFPVDEKVAICIEERVPIVSFFWGDPTRYIDRVHAGDGKVIHQVGGVEDAQRAAGEYRCNHRASVEAGGHIAGEVFERSPWCASS